MLEVALVAIDVKIEEGFQLLEVQSTAKDLELQRIKILNEVGLIPFQKPLKD